MQNKNMLADIYVTILTVPFHHSLKACSIDNFPHNNNFPLILKELFTSFVLQYPRPTDKKPQYLDSKSQLKWVKI